MSNQENMRWADMLGHALIKKIEMHVGDNCACDSCFQQQQEIWCPDNKRKIDEVTKDIQSNKKTKND
jgi:hypothetical protein